MVAVKETLFFSVVIVSSRQTPEKISACLNSLFQDAYPIALWEIVVVDSGAGPAVLNYLQLEEKNHPNLRVILPGRGNIGPARGRNLGIKVAKGAIVAFTDDDIVVADGWLSRLADGYQRYPEVAGVGGMSLPLAEVTANNLWAQYENFLYRCLLQKVEGEYLSDKRDEHPCYAGNISYRKGILAKAGGFDEAFSPLIYGEDGDLKERVLQQGYRLLYLPVINRHWADYNFRTFWRKEERRGLGILFYLKRRSSRKPLKFVEIIKIALFPTVLFHKWRGKAGLKLSIIAVLAFFARQWGKLKYYEKV